MALAIVALVCVGVLAAYGAALRADVTAADRLPLSALAIERLARIDLDDGALDRLPDSLVHGTFSAPYATATWTVATARVATARVARAADLFDVAVQVRDGNDVFTLRTRRYRATP
ncbi:MAG: hypothetical protein JWM95_453 [Gemmatimonadetes bacterium]|nr:hypothetical protein [Gemmatimonadota bacterium]